MKKTILLISVVFFTFFFNACEKDPSGSDSSSTDDGISHEESSDYTWDNSTVADIILNGTSIETASSDVTVSGSVATITAAGNYRISGSLSNGQIIVDAGKTSLVRVILNGASITNSSGSALLIEKSSKTIINLAESTENMLTDGSTYSNSADDPNAALFSKTDLTIFGSGSLTVKGNYDDGITSKDGLIIKSGTITVTAVDDGIRGKDFLIVEDGNIAVNSGGDGLKSDNEGNSSVGYIAIENGTFNITSTGGDGISAVTNITATGGDFFIKTGGGSTGNLAYNTSAKGIKGLVGVTLGINTCIINSADDAIHSNNDVTINSGTYTIATGDDCIHADATLTANDGNIGVTKAYEGFESKTITINSGYISVATTDDSFNATAGQRTETDDKSYLYINGGYIVLNATTGDPLDSNGSIAMKGGTVVAHGPNSQPEVGIDYNGSFNISGGILAVSGPSTNMFQGVSTSSSQYSVKISFKSSVAASTIFHIQDADGNNVVTFKPARKYLTMVASSPALVKGSTYSIYKGGTSSGTDDGGLYTDGIYSPGTLVTTFTVSSSVTNLSNL
jgi:hypothetical protein